MSAMDPATHVTATKKGKLLLLVLDGPKGNILTGAAMKELAAVLSEHADDPHLCLVAIQGRGKHFSFGASVEEHRRAEAGAMLSTFHALIRQVGGYPIPIAAVVDGRCLGGAFELALACHFVLATPGAVFACPEIKLGVLPPVLAALGPSRLGAATAERLLLTGGELDARAAHALGFVAELAPDGVTPEALLAQWFEKYVAPLSAFALRQGVAAARRGSGMAAALDAGIAAAEEQYLGRILPSHDGNEGIEAFLAKRRPEWRDT